MVWVGRVLQDPPVPTPVQAALRLPGPIHGLERLQGRSTHSSLVARSRAAQRHPALHHRVSIRRDKSSGCSLRSAWGGDCIEAVLQGAHPSAGGFCTMLGAAPCSQHSRPPRAVQLQQRPFHLALIISREHSAPELRCNERHRTRGSQLTIANALDPRKILCSNYIAIIICTSIYSSGAERACAMYLNFAPLSCH